MGVFVFNCPHCGKPIGAQDEWEGKTSMCPHCQKPVVIQHAVPSSEMPTGNGPMPSSSSGPPAVSGWDDYYMGPAGVSEYAKNSLWLGIAGVCCCNICGIAAIVLGIMGLNEISHSNGRLEGKAYAWGGISLGILPYVLLVIQLFLFPKQQLGNGLLKMFEEGLFKQSSRIERYEEYKTEPVKPLPSPKSNSDEQDNHDEREEDGEPIREQSKERLRKPDELI